MTPLPNREQLFRQVLIRAVTSPPSLLLGSTGLLLLASPVAGPVAPVAWLVGLTALAADAGWIWNRVRNPGFARHSSDEMLRQRWRDLLHRLEELTAVLDRDTAAALSAIVESQERLMGMLGAGTSALPPSRMELTSLLQHCLSLADKRHRLQNYLSTFRSQDLQHQAMRLPARVDQCPDPVTRSLYEQALDQKRQELENYALLEEALVRIDGQLAAVQCTFDNMLSKMVRMQSVEVVGRDTASDPFVAELNRLTTGVAALEASLNETLTVGGVG
jgi:hypothetical protein